MGWPIFSTKHLEILKMISTLVVLALMSTPTDCKLAHPIQAGDTASCAGLVLPPDMVRAALKCKRVELPKLQAELTYEREALRSAKASHRAELNYYQATLDTGPPPWWVKPVIAIAFAGIGYAAGSLVAK